MTYLERYALAATNAAIADASAQAAKTLNMSYDTRIANCNRHIALSNECSKQIDIYYAEVMRRIRAGDANPYDC